MDYEEEEEEELTVNGTISEEKLLYQINLVSLFFFFFFDNRGYTHVHTRTFSSPLFLVAHHVVQFKKHWEESDVYD